MPISARRRLGDRRDGDRLSVQTRAAAGRCAEQLSVRDVEHDARRELAVNHGGDRHGVPRDAVEKIRRAIERIDNEREPGRILQRRRQLLAENPRVGMPRRHNLGDRTLGGAIDVGDEIGVRLHLPVERPAIVRAFANDRPRRAPRRRRRSPVAPGSY